MKKIIFIIILAISAHITFAQKDTVRIAEELIYNENFNLAINLYRKIRLTILTSDSATFTLSTRETPQFNVLKTQ